MHRPMNKIRPANISDRPSKRNVMFKPKDGTHVQYSMTGEPLNTTGACHTRMAKLLAVMAAATAAINTRRWAPPMAVSSVPSNKGNKTTSNSTVGWPF